MFSLMAAPKPIVEGERDVLLMMGTPLLSYSIANQVFLHLKLSLAGVFKFLKKYFHDVYLCP
jgi:hypothetical protein